jgi:hypothetical protein
VETAILVGDVVPPARWAWHLLAERLDVEVRLHVVSPTATEVVVTTSRSGTGLPRHAVERLAELVETLRSV